MTTTTIDRAHAAWGADIPAWIVVLAEVCEHRTQVSVADEIRYSSSVVGRVLSHKYRGDYSAVAMAVQGGFMGASVECPILGTLLTHRCLEEQNKPYMATNPQQVRLFSACRNCKHNRKDS